jgi:hypothetical protein
MAEIIDYIYLARREGSGYQQYFVKGCNLRAEEGGRSCGAGTLRVHLHERGAP